MFQIGEKVFYPNHGGALIDAIEEREIQGRTQEYYVLKFALENISIMVPVDSSEKTGIRKICNVEELNRALDVLKEEGLVTDKNWSRRYRINEQKIKSGNLQSIAEVVRDLTRADRIKKLSPGENKIYENATNIFLSEIMLIQEISVEEARNILEKLIN